MKYMYVYPSNPTHKSLPPHGFSHFGTLHGRLDTEFPQSQMAKSWDLC